MKLLMVVVDEACKEEVEVALQRAGVAGFTEIPGAVGMGTSGPRLGSAAFPKTSAVILSFVEDDQVAALKERVRTDCPARARPHLVTWTVEPHSI